MNTHSTDRWRWTTAYDLTAEQVAFQERVRDLAHAELVPLLAGAVPGRVNRPLVAAMGRLGLLSSLFRPPSATLPPHDEQPEPSGARPEPSDGHADVSAFRLCLLRETLAAVTTEAETALALQGLGGYPLIRFGTHKIAGRWRAPIEAGSAVAAFALSEAEAGSDAGALLLLAEPDGDGWRLSGEKLWISNAPEADVYTVFARTTAGARSRGVTAFAVPGDADGLSGEHLKMLSPHPIGRLIFDGVQVSRDDVIGDVNDGFRVAMRTLDLFRPSVGAFAVGMAQAALEATIEHTTSREAFGGRLCDQQAVAHLIAEMATRVEASRLLVYASAAAYDAAGGGVAADGRTPGNAGISCRSAMAKLFATENAQFVVDAAVQLHGARGLVEGHLLAHLYREVRAPRIYEGASEVQRTIIGRALTGPSTQIPGRG
jgi:alkylation response protein AidB-like acyl-CoA dehydrogenase